MEANVIWNKLLELAATERLWDAEAYIVNLSARSNAEEGDVEDEMVEEALPEPQSTIYHLKGSASTGAFFAYALKRKLAQMRTRDLRFYDYLADGKLSVMCIDLQEHNDLFRDVIHRLDRGDFEETGDIDEARQGSFFLVRHDLDLDGQRVRCVSGRKTFPRRQSKRVSDGNFPTVGVMFENGQLKAVQQSYFEFDEDIDFLLLDTKIFIFSKYYFEQSTRFTKKMYEQTDEAWNEIVDALFVESENMLLDLLTENPKKARRKIAKIKKADESFFDDPDFIGRFEQANREEEWGFAFERTPQGELKMRFPYTDETRIDHLFTILNDGRLHSKLTGRTYDTDSKREIKHG